MFEKLIAYSLRQRALVLLATLGLVAAGFFALTRLPIDAVPDVTNNQVQVLTQAPALSPLEVERLVTLPIELSLKSLPDVVELRSVSKAGISVVTIVFKERVETYFGRQLILEKLREAEEDLPEGVGTPELGPVSTGLGEVFRYVVRDTTGRLSPMELRTIQDWIVRRQLLGVPGLAEVNSLGGYTKQFQVLVDPDRLAAYGLTLRDVFDAAAAASGTSGGGYIETGPEQLSVRSVGLVTTLEDLQNTVIRATSGGVPVQLGDVAEVRVGPALRFGAATQDGRGEVVTGFTMQLKGANARVVVSAVKERIAEIQRTLPQGVVIEPYYDRTALVERTIATVARNLAEGALLVIVVLLLFLAHLRAGLILASVIPLAMLFAIICMVATGQSGNLMSLGAIDFGLVVDGALIIVENVLRLLGKREAEGDPVTDDEGMRSLVYSGAAEMVRSAKYGVFIIILVYLPIVTLQGIEGKLFRPMALTVGFALIGALLLSVTYVPVMCSLFLRRKKPIRESRIVEFLHHRYRPALERVLRIRKPVVAATVAAFALAVLGFTRLGGEFIPRLDEGDLALQVIRLPSVSLTESAAIQSAVERRIKAFPEVKTMVSSIGRAEVSTDPMGVEIADAFVILKDRRDWPEVEGRRRTKDELVEAMSEAVEDIPAGVQFLQPIEMRTNELIAGVRGDVAVKLFGESFDVLNPAAERIAGILRSTEGGTDVTLEQTSGFPTLVVRPDRAALSRYGISPVAVNELVATAVGGEAAGQVYEGERRFDLVVRYADSARASAGALAAMLVPTATGARVPLRDIASVTVEEGPAQVSREEGSRFVTVQANVRGRDVASFVGEVQQKVDAQVKLPAGYRIDYGGQFENLQEASKRLTLVVPLALAMIFLLLFQTFGSLRLGALIFLCVPMSIIGGVAALYLAGMPFSISAGVGFIALFGIAVLNGIVLVAAFQKFENEGLERHAAVLAGADERLRPVVTTATLAALGFVPMLLAHGAGAEVQRPLATVIIGGLVTSTVLTLFVLPIVYLWLAGHPRQWRKPSPEEVEAETYTPPPGSPSSITATEPTHGNSQRGIVLGAALLLMFAVPAVSSAQPASAFAGLAEAQAQAIQATPGIQARAALLAQQQALRAALGIRPATSFFANLDKARPDALAEMETAIGVSQPLLAPGLIRAQRRVGDAALRQAEAEILVARRAVRQQATQAFFDVAAARAQLALADTTAALVEAFARASQRRQDLGDAGALEAVQAAVEADRAAQRRAEAAGELRAAEGTLRVLLGRADTSFTLPASSLPGIDLITRPSGPGATDSLVSRALAASPEVLSARAARDAARETRRVVAYERRPGIAVEASHQTIGARPGFLGAGVSVAVPLGRQANRAPDRAAEAAEAAAEATLAQAEREATIAVTTQAARLEAALSSLGVLENRLLPRARQAYGIALRLRAAGEATYFEVLAAQNALVEARGDYARALARALRERATLDLLLTTESY